VSVVEKIIAAVGGVVGGFIVLFLWLLAINRQLKRVEGNRGMG
jgi:hypothetical protein